MPFIVIDDPLSLPDAEVDRVFRRLEEDGWVVIQSNPAGDPEQILVDLQSIFGGVVFHPYSKEEGVVVVDNAYRPPRAMSPHTDGTYYPTPPALMCLQCVTAATTGGASTLVDGARVYDYLASEMPDDLTHLFEPVMGVRRENRFVEAPVFWRQGDRIGMRFRIDETIALEVAPRARRAVDAIHEFIQDPANQLEFTLQPMQTLIVDNVRTLHGRTAYDGREQRKMNRMHLDGRSPRGTLRLGFTPAEAATAAV